MISKPPASHRPVAQWPRSRLCILFVCPLKVLRVRQNPGLHGKSMENLWGNLVGVQNSIKFGMFDGQSWNPGPQTTSNRFLDSRLFSFFTCGQANTKHVMMISAKYHRTYVTCLSLNTVLDFEKNVAQNTHVNLA